MKWLNGPNKYLPGANTNRRNNYILNTFNITLFGYLIAFEPPTKNY